MKFQAEPKEREGECERSDRRDEVREIKLFRIIYFLVRGRNEFHWPRDHSLCLPNKLGSITQLPMLQLHNTTVIVVVVVVVFNRMRLIHIESYVTSIIIYQINETLIESRVRSRMYSIWILFYSQVACVVCNVRVCLRAKQRFFSLSSLFVNRAIRLACLNWIVLGWCIRIHWNETKKIVYTRKCWPAQSRNEHCAHARHFKDWKRKENFDNCYSFNIDAVAAAVVVVITACGSI